MTLKELLKMMGGNEEVLIDQFKAIKGNVELFRGTRSGIYDQIVRDERFGEHKGKMVKLASKQVLAVGNIWSEKHSGIYILIEGRKAA